MGHVREIFNRPFRCSFFNLKLPITLHAGLITFSVTVPSIVDRFWVIVLEVD